MRESVFTGAMAFINATLKRKVTIVTWERRRKTKTKWKDARKSRNSLRNAKGDSGDGSSSLIAGGLEAPSWSRRDYCLVSFELS